MNSTAFQTIAPRSFARLVAPSVTSMVFMALYTIVDGMFVARFVGENALAAVNIAMPLVNLMVGLSVMLGAGGSAALGILLGEGRCEKAGRGFSFLLLAGLVLGLVLVLALLPLLGPLLPLLGATAELYGYCMPYAAILTLFAPLLVVKTLLEYFTRTAGAPTYSLLSPSRGA